MVEPKAATPGGVALPGGGRPAFERLGGDDEAILSPFAVDRARPRRSVTR